MVEADQRTGQRTVAAIVAPSVLARAVRLCLVAEVGLIAVQAAVLVQKEAGLAGALLAGALLLAWVSTRYPRGAVWDQSYGRISLSAFYLVLGPLVTYALFDWRVGALFAALHLFLVRRLAWGELARLRFEVVKGSQPC